MEQGRASGCKSSFRSSQPSVVPTRPTSLQATHATGSSACRLERKQPAPSPQPACNRNNFVSHRAGSPTTAPLPTATGSDELIYQPSYTFKTTRRYCLTVCTVMDGKGLFVYQTYRVIYLSSPHLDGPCHCPSILQAGPNPP